jgi:hypothetical protein
MGPLDQRPQNRRAEGRTRVRFWFQIHVPALSGLRADE